MSQLQIPGLEDAVTALQRGRSARAFGFIGKFLGRTVSEAAAFSAGVAIGPVLSPVVQAIRNQVNSQYAFVYPDPITLANGVAQGQVDEKVARAYASYHGFGDDAMTALIDVANTGPALGYAFQAWRRINPATGKSYLSDAEFRTALKRTGLEEQWYPAIMGLKENLLDLQTLANGIQRGLIQAPFELPYDAQPAPGQIEPFPTVPIDVAAALEGLGYSMDDLKLEVGLAGNPPGPEALYRAQFRGAIDGNDVLRGLVEGRARGEWAKAYEADARQIPTVTEFVENAIRGYSTLDAAIAGGARHGMTAEDVTLIYQNAGRPLSPHQITQALARGAKFNPIPGELTDPYEASAHESSVKPSYQEMYIALSHTYPSLFQLSQLVKGNAITPDTAADWATKDGYAPEVVTTLHAFWSGGATNSGSAKKLTPTQVKTAYHAGDLDRAAALQRLEALGYSATDAALLLGNPPPSA